jgi:hypothetical protein
MLRAGSACAFARRPGLTLGVGALTQPDSTTALAIVKSMRRESRIMVRRYGRIMSIAGQ